MKNLLNLKGLCRSSQLALNPDGQTTVERRSNDGHSRRHLPVGLTKLLSLFFLLTLGVGQMWGANRYIYIGLSNDYHTYKDASTWGINFSKNNASYELLKPTDINATHNDGQRDYHMYRVLVSEDKNQAEFKGNDSWWKSKSSVTLNGTTNNAIFFSASADGWEGCFQDNYQVTSTASLLATRTSMTTAQTSTLTPSLSSNATYNEIKSTSYSVTTNPGNGGSVTSAGVFSATKTGTYTVTATITYNAKDFTGITKTATATRTITVMGTPSVSLTVDKVNVNQITLTGTITNYNNSGSNASSLSEVGFYIGATKYTATYKSGSTFKKTITGLSANTAYSNVKAFATNAVSQTGNSSTQTVTTLADATYRIQVRVPHNAAAPHIYAWTDADDYGGSKMENSTYASAPAATLGFAATTYDWYYYDVNNKYEKFLINTTGDSDKSEDFAATRSSDCYWYNKSAAAGSRAAKMDCPEFEPHLVLKVGAGSDSRYEMSGSGTVSVAQTLTASTTYSVKVMYNTEYYGKTSSSIARTGSTSSNAISGMVVEGAYITLTADLAGTYTFSFNTSTKTLSVSYPEAYRITYSATTVGGGTGNSAAPTASYNSGATSVTSGTTWIPTGTTVNFSAKSAKEGYTFKGWYSNTPDPSNWATNRIQEGASYNRTVSAAATIYAVYDENDYTITVTKTAGGSIASTSVTGHKSTKTTLPTATPDPGYYFTGWTTTTGTLTYTNQSSATAAQVNGLTAAATVQANFAPIWRLVGSMNSWNEGTNPLLNYSTEGGKNYVYVEVSLNANTQYSFKVKDVQTSKMYKPTSSNTEITYANKATAQGMNNTAGGDPNQTIMTAAAGTYRFTWNITDKSIKVTYPTSWKVTFGMGTGGNTITASGSTTGAITSGKYVANGENVTFAQTARTGYTFAGWYTATSDGSAVPTMAVNDNVLNTITADATVYSRYAENMTTVNLSATNGKIQYWDGDSWEDAASSVNVGVATNCSIKAVPATGYYFAGWVNTEGTDYEIIGSFNDEANTNTTLKGKGSGETTGQTLTANFVELDKIYFRNWNEDRSEPLWENVYAYFSISYEDNCAKSNSSSDYSGILMTREGTSNVYWVYVPRGTTRNNDDDIAFSNHNFGINYKFHNYEAVMRGDYKTEWNMFVPQHSNTSLKNSTTYYNGYWKHHNVAVGTDAGYRIERYNGSGYVDPVDNGDGSEHHRDFTVGSENTIIYQLRIDNLTSGYNNYRIYNEGGTHYITFGESVQETGYTLTNTDCSNIGLSEYNSGSPRFYITPTSEGTYTLTIDMSGDVMRLSVNYPVAKGDYQLIHSYNDGTAKVTRSDVIKTTDERQYSMYIDNTTAHSPSLVLKKCTEISDGNPVWSAGTSVDMSGFTANTKGVYVFDVAIAGDAATLKKIEPYRGNYYIKTDVAKGGWTSYTENAMEENTINATDFDYYYCKYIGSVDTNIKCVIANDYCNAVSDTLEGDDVIGAEVQTMPYAGSVRFSYNSATNELKRAYLNGSGDWERYFLELQAGSAVIKARNGSYFTNNKVKFTDNGNWIYHLELQAQEGARVKLVAHYYNGSTTINQYFKGADGGGSFDDAYTEELIGSTGESSWLGLSIIYDFKTNNLIAAWSPSGSIDATINLNTDVLLIHNRKVIKSAGDEVSMIDLTDTNGDGVYGDVKNINKVFSALRFLKESDGTYIGMTGTPANTAESYYRYNYWISFPYDVKMTDIFGISGYGSKWRIQYYDGEERADKGWYLGDGTTTFWKTMTMSDDTKLEKGRGYVLQLSPSAFQATGSGSLWELSDEIYLYFPSKAKFGNISRYTSSVTLSSLPCTKGLYTDGSGKNHNLTDSHWHVFGIPTFKNATGTTGTGDNYYDGEDAGTEQEAHTISGDPFYFYMYNNDGTTYNTYTVTSSSVSTFQPMHAYMIQMTGTLNFAINSVPASVAARQKKEIQNYDLRLELASEGQVADQTFVTLRENAVADFALNEDLTKIHNTGKANIYSYAGVYDVAANILPVENRTVVLGVETAKAGTYTFSMPDNFDGTVTLIDNFTQTRTNLALGDYEVSLPKGEMNDRFLLEINIRQVPTAIDGVEGGSLKDGKAHKFIENGAMYILRDGQIYDARGNKVK